MLWYEQLQEEERRGKEEQERIKKEVRRNLLLSKSRFKPAMSLGHSLVREYSKFTEISLTELNLGRVKI